MSPSEIANLLRTAADEEMTSEQSQRLEAHLEAHPADRAIIDFERRLREAVGRVMGADEAPAGLRDQLRSPQAGLTEPLSFDAGARAASAPVARGAHGARAGRGRWLPSGLAAGFLLLIGAAVVISVISPRQLFEWFRPSQINVDVEGVSGFPSEHHRCATDEQYARKKFNIHSAEELESHLRNDFGWEVEVPDLSAFGYNLLDAGDCTMGAGGSGVDSIHLRYSNDQNVVSVWIEHSLPSELTHSAGLKEGVAYRIVPLDRRMGRDEDNAYFAWRIGEYVFRFVPASVDRSREMAVGIGMPDVTPSDFN